MKGHFITSYKHLKIFKDDEGAVRIYDYTNDGKQVGGTFECVLDAYNYARLNAACAKLDKH